jgi:hypothetical protein
MLYKDEKFQNDCPQMLSTAVKDLVASGLAAHDLCSLGFCIPYLTATSIKSSRADRRGS